MNVRIREALIAFTIILVAAAPPAPATAQTQQQIDWCSGKGGATSDLVFGECTVVIQSGRFTGRNLAIAFYNRGPAYDATKDYDQAIAEYDQAVRLDPVENLKTLAAHTEQKIWTDEIKAKLAQYKISAPQDKAKVANESAPKSWTMAAEVLARLEATKDYRELSALYNRKVAADLNWLQSAEGRPVDAQLKNWRSDAAATVIVDDKEGRILRYSVGGVIVRDPGIAAADLEKSPAYRRTIAEAIAQNIMTSPLDPKVRAALATFRNEPEASSAAAGELAAHLIGVYQSTDAGMGVGSDLRSRPGLCNGFRI